MSVHGDSVGGVGLVVDGKRGCHDGHDVLRSELVEDLQVLWIQLYSLGTNSNEERLQPVPLRIHLKELVDQIAEIQVCIVLADFSDHYRVRDPTQVTEGVGVDAPARCPEFDATQKLTKQTDIRNALEQVVTGNEPVERLLGLNSELIEESLILQSFSDARVQPLHRGIE